MTETKNAPPSDAPALPAVSVLHYQAVCGLCLGLVFLAQLQQGLGLSNLLTVAIGVWGLVARMRSAPTLFLVFIAGTQLADHIIRSRFGNVFRPSEIDVGEVLLCTGVLGYVAAHYRLQSIWSHLLPPDPRQRAGEPTRSFPWFNRRPPVVAEKRDPGQMTPQELARLIVTLPAWALAAQIAWVVLPARPDLVGLPPRLGQLLLIVWCLAIAFFVTGTFLHLWRHRQRGRDEAQMFLQDTLWNETRGEQRRISRWLAWMSRKDRG